jgi:hypothetical protein
MGLLYSNHADDDDANEAGPPPHRPQTRGDFRGLKKNPTPGEKFKSKG